MKKNVKAKTPLPRLGKRRGLQELYYVLNDAYWKEKNAARKRKLSELSTELFDVITEMNRADIWKRDTALKGKSAKLKKAVREIESLNRRVRKTVEAVRAAAGTAAGAEKILEHAAKFL